MMIHNDRPHKIQIGNARELIYQVPNDSIDLVIADPVYTDLCAYEWLGYQANRVLKPNKPCLAWGQTNLMDKQIAALSANLTWRWLLCWYQSNNMRVYHPVYNKVVPLYWFDKGKSKPKRFQDLRNKPLSVGSNRQDKHHKWAKHTAIISYYLRAFSEPGDLILDPFAGSGTVPLICIQENRRFIAFEIDQDTATYANNRLENAQPPLFTMNNGIDTNQASLKGFENGH